MCKLKFIIFAIILITSILLIASTSSIGITHHLSSHRNTAKCILNDFFLFLHLLKLLSKTANVLSNARAAPAALAWLPTHTELRLKL